MPYISQISIEAKENSFGRINKEINESQAEISVLREKIGEMESKRRKLFTHRNHWLRVRDEKEELQKREQERN